ncbi:MAG TPA: 6-pyruvoyl-tetrahydropterin synthase-related protein, partial [bacterium]|nr:6-pyruvoyl-tetrahydropterin synthase-related protein [bacterium]
ENRWQGSERNYNQTGVYIGMIAFIFSIFGLWAVRRKKIGWFFMGAAIVGWGMAVPVRYFAVLNQLPVLELFAPYRWRLIVQFALIVLSVFGFDYLRRYMRRSRLFAGLAIGLLCLDLFAAHASYLPAQKAVDAADRHEILTYLMKHTGGSERVVWFGDNYSPNYAVLDGLSDVRGADSLFVSRYEALVKYYLHKDRDYYLMTKAADAFLDFYGVKYIVTTSAADFIERGGSVQTVIDVHADEAVGYQPVREDPLAVFENVDAAPRAYITHSWQPFGIRQTVDEEIAISGLDPTRVFIEERQNEDAIESRLATAQTGAVAVTPATIVRYDPDRVEIATNAAEPGLLVLSDTFYPGWEVTVDGVSQPVYAVDEAVRGTFVPAGIHEIIFIFRSRSFTIGIATCLVTIVVLIWLSLPSVQRHLRSLIWEVRYRIFDR